ncbi:BON domain-containing protein [Azospirillum thermophilum]|uniref:BON domain-containing protein n=1 Tax=Azospirillum thermophilum TaxID=2202148 RepID=A0A2S2CS46_9PROT|nr:BON domain-containing protein [Azospirillum thermophilum]AWK87298.1 hypothetical protein DEW08_14685 [Azospirillum thermophilum]
MADNHDRRDDRQRMERTDRRREDWSADYGRFGSDFGGHGRASHRGGGGTDFGTSQTYRGFGGYGRYGRGQNERFWDREADEASAWFGDEDAERPHRMDNIHAGEGRHRGRGPRGYTRPDERIREDVNDRLTEDPYVDASDIEVTVSGGEVTLSGTVDSRNARRRAEDIAEGVPGVRHVQNDIRASRPGADRASGTRTTGAGASAMAGLGSGGRDAETGSDTGGAGRVSTSRS